MKGTMEDRIRRIEDALRGEEVIPMVALKTEQGIKWNGAMYPDEKALHEAVETICGRNPRKPLVIICRYGNRRKDLQ